MHQRLSEPPAEILNRLEARVDERLEGPERLLVAQFLRLYYARAPEDLLAARAVLDLYGAGLAHFHLARQRAPGETLLRVYNPILEEHGWESPHTVVEIVTDDMAFLVDSVVMEVHRQGLQVLEIIHPIMGVRRGADGGLLALVPRASEGPRLPEAVIHLELVRQSEAGLLERLRQGIQRVLGDVGAAVHDWPAMRETLSQVLTELQAAPPSVPAQDLQEGLAFLRWLDDHHFTFLGYRCYDLTGAEGEESLHICPGSGLGILRQARDNGESQAFAGLPPELKRQARTPRLLLLTKANARATVHRPVNLDYVGVRRFDAAGQVIGEHRFLGLYGSRAYSCLPEEIPVVRRKLAQVQKWADLDPDGHSAKALLHILETYPRDELFQIEAEDLYRIGMGILQLDERQRPRLFLRQDLYGRYVMCLVYVPRDRYDSRVRRRMQQVLREAFGAAEVEFSVSLNESPLARVVFLVRTQPGSLPAYDTREIEGQLVEAIETWGDELHSALLERLGEARGSALCQEYGDAFPAGYREDFHARSAVRDIEQMEELSGDDLEMALYRPLEAPPGRLRFKVFRRDTPMALHQALPILENMAVQMDDERPYRVETASGTTLWVHDFGLSHAPRPGVEAADIRGLFQEAFAAVWRGRMANDGFNALVLLAQLDWRRVSLLRCYAKYLRQTAITFSQPYMEEAMAVNPHIARHLVELFEARFDPQRPPQAQQRISRLTAQLQEALDAVQSLDHDRILRSFLAALQATLRTNWYQRDAARAHKQAIAIKLDPRQIPDLPEPRPLFEIFVYSPRMEGVHLRGGRVARGGLRWSDRREDFRTEVLGLMKAQMVKNAVIVPVGAKGGFVVKHPPTDGDRESLRREVMDCYRQFVAGLLDLTDNLTEEGCRPPSDLVRYDGDDPYLVVAADKGTATFSDLANEVAAGYRFWLGDAFASGGRTGYDHKRMAITASGAWECVRQHFRAAAIDYEHQSFSVVGIGDMSGDVFGNGLLWSRRMRLLAAFDHRHIFLDPDPDPELSYRERQRLFALPTSSWADYDPARISPGGGVYPRTLKSVRLSPQARAALGIDAQALTPADLIRALLRAPVDLLWNGGIGTYVKASWERHADVGDRLNDPLRVDAPQLRCRVVGEGGNLGFTQAARIEYARHGGRLDTDFIHNVGGVNCSDHEVNIKILLDRVVVDGDLTLKQRDRLLAEMTEEVAALVLQDSYWQACAIGLEEAQASALLPEHGRYLRRLEQSGHLNRALELLPDDTALAERQAAAQGLTRPEIALLVSYAKHALTEELLASDLPEDPCMAPELERYFPSPLRERFRERIHGHRLRREILCSTVANRLVNRFGSTFVFRLQEELGLPAAAIVRAIAVVWDALGLRRLWSQAAALPSDFPEELRLGMLIRAGRLAGRACRRLLQVRGTQIPVGALLERYRAPLAALMQHLPGLLDQTHPEALAAAAAPYLEAGAPPALATWVGGMDALAGALDLVDVATQAQVDVREAAEVYFRLAAELDIDWLARRLAALPRQDRWHASARAGLRDDLQQQLRALCAAVLSAPPPDTSVAARLELWRHRQHTASDRYRRLIADLRAQGDTDMAMLAVALREIGRLVESTAAAPEGGQAA